MRIDLFTSFMLIVLLITLGLFFYSLMYRNKVEAPAELTPKQCQIIQKLKFMEIAV